MRDNTERIRLRVMWPHQIHSNKIEIRLLERPNPAHVLAELHSVYHSDTPRFGITLDATKLEFSLKNLDVKALDVVADQIASLQKLEDISRVLPKRFEVAHFRVFDAVFVVSVCMRVDSRVDVDAAVNGTKVAFSSLLKAE